VMFYLRSSQPFLFEPSRISAEIAPFLFPGLGHPGVILLLGFQLDNRWERVDGSGKRAKLSESSSIGLRNFSMDTDSLIMPSELIKEPNSSRPMNL